MSSNEAHLLQRITDLATERDEYKRGIATAMAEAAISRVLGPHFCFALAPALARSLRVSLEKGSPVAQVLDESGHARTHIKDGRFTSFTLDDAVREFADQHVDVVQRIKSATAKNTSEPEAKPAKESDTELLGRLQREHAGKVKPAWTDADRAYVRKNNPMAPATRNLTWEMKVRKFDPALAAELERMAGHMPSVA